MSTNEAADKTEPSAAASAAAGAAGAEDATDTVCEYDHLDDLDLPPLRLRAGIRDGCRLSASNLNIPPGIQSTQKRYSLDSKANLLATASPTGVGSIAGSSCRGKSRSRSPSLRAKEQRSLAGDGNSSLSSLEEFVDPDILYDKMAYVELDAKDNGKSGGKLGSQGGHSSFTYGDNQNTRLINLTPVSERMSEDTLEDVHAFSDLSANTNTRPSSSVGTGGSTVGGEVSSHILAPLDEGDEDLESEDDAEKLGADDRQPSQVIVTNLENIALGDGDRDNDNHQNEGKP